jgi:hypothetical protein
MATGIAVWIVAMTSCNGTAGASVLGNPTPPSDPIGPPVTMSVYVVATNPVAGGSILRLESTSTGSATPISTLTPPATATFLSVATDSSGQIYAGVATNDGSEVLVYPAGSTGAATPTRAIVGSSGSFSYPYLMTVGSDGLLYVSDGFCNCVSVFSKTATGAATPIRLIQGDSTQIDDPIAIAVDSSGYLYIADPFGVSLLAPTYKGPQIEIFAPGATGDVAPVQVITGTASTPLLPISGMAIAGNAEIYVNHGFEIVRYTGTPAGSFVPVNTVIPSATETPSSSLSVDDSGNIYVLWLAQDGLTQNISVYTNSATGSATP